MSKSPEGQDAIVAVQAREIARLRKALEDMTCCDFHDGNCASLEVASRRVRNMARMTLNGAVW